MADLLWVREQMNLRKLANQFLSKVKSTGVKRVLITSVQKGDGKARFITELAAEMARVNQELVPLAAANLHVVEPTRFMDSLVIVYGPAYFESAGLHTIPERWMRAFDAVVVIVMAHRTRSRDLLKLINWLKEYNYHHIWPVLNEKESPDISESWLRLKGKLGLEKTHKRRPRSTPASVWQPLLSPAPDITDYLALPSAELENVSVISNVKVGDSLENREAAKVDISVAKSDPPPKRSYASNPPANVTTTVLMEAPSSAPKGPNSMGRIIEDNPIFIQTSPQFLQSVKATIRSSAPPPSTKKTSSNPPPKHTPTKESLSLPQTVPQVIQSTRTIISSSVPPPSINRTSSSPPPKHTTTKEGPSLVQTIPQIIQSTRTIVSSSVPSPSINRTNSDTPLKNAPAKENPSLVPIIPQLVESLRTTIPSSVPPPSKKRTSSNPPLSKHNPTKASKDS